MVYGIDQLPPPPPGHDDMLLIFLVEHLHIFTHFFVSRTIENLKFRKNGFKFE